MPLQKFLIISSPKIHDKMSSTAKGKKYEELKAKLSSNDEAIALEALTQIREIGNEQFIEPLITLFATTDSHEIRKNASEILGSLKITAAEPILIDALSNSAFSSIRKNIIEFIWSSGMQPVTHISKFTSIAINGSFEEALECTTLLDSLETALPEEVLLDSITMIKQHLSQSKEDDKTALLRQYLLALENQRIED